jgi:hypothetical protein
MNLYARSILNQLYATRAEVASATHADATLADWRQIAAAAADLSTAIEDRREHRRRYQLGVASLPPLARTAAALLLVLAVGCSPSGPSTPVGHDATEVVVSPACRVEVRVAESEDVKTVILAVGQARTVAVGDTVVELRVVPAFAPSGPPVLPDALLEEMQ